MKHCSKCKKWKDFDKFHKDKQKIDGLCSKCKECCNKYQKNYYEKTKKN